jgi:predicted O-methyltransferase YrrM
MPSSETWNAVDLFFNDRLIGHDAVLDKVQTTCTAAGLPPISVAANQGRLLNLLASLVGARRILEIGTLGGYSAIWMARALPADGRLISLEIDAKHAEVARANLALAGLADRVEVRLGRAIDLLPGVAGPFDLVFIDADKPSNPDYFAWAMRLVRPGSVIVVDNVVRGGTVADAASSDPTVLGVRRLVDLVAAERRVAATAIQTVGSKGYDGLLIARVIA